MSSSSNATEESVPLVVGQCYRVEHKVGEEGGYASDKETTHTRVGKLTEITDIEFTFTLNNGKLYHVKRPASQKMFYEIACPTTGGKRRSRRHRKNFRSCRRSRKN